MLRALDVLFVLLCVVNAVSDFVGISPTKPWVAGCLWLLLGLNAIVRIVQEEAR